MALESLGWDAGWDKTFAAMNPGSLAPARVMAEHKERYEIHSGSLIYTAEVSGKYRFRAERREDFPAVGDWVGFDPADQDYGVIHTLLPRRTKLSRKDKLRPSEEQILASNIDFVFVVTSANQEFNLRRIERFLVIVKESGAHPLIVLNKTDLAENLDATVKQARSTGYEVAAVSAVRANGLESLHPWMGAGKTIAFIGSSGVGKSTIINTLLEHEVQRTTDLRPVKDKGRHTTTRRELFILDGGALLIDTPGIREIQLWGDEESVEDAFDDISELGKRCRFRDCSHESEPGCAVLEAMQSGTLDERRYANYVKMRKELLYLKRRMDPVLARAEKDRWKKIHKAQRQLYKIRKKSK